MSTPYVGLNQVQHEARHTEVNAWVGENTPILEMPLHAKTMVKRQLVQLLQHSLGVTTIQVGPVWMKLSEDVPEKHLVKAAHFLLRQFKSENRPSRHTKLLEEILSGLLRY